MSNKQSPPAVGSRLERWARALRGWRIRRAQREVVGLRARLDATRELVRICKRTVPGALVLDMQRLPQRIAEVEELLRQLAT